MEFQLPVNDTIIAAVAQLIDDARTEDKREPTHGDLDFYISRAKLSSYDPKVLGQTVGKAKRVRAVLHAALDAGGTSAASQLIQGIMSKVRACGGFRPESVNFVGLDSIANARDAFEKQGITLHPDGSLTPVVLSSLRGSQLTAALERYALRAQHGAEDAALLAGTGKDLIEATAAHILVSLNGSYPQNANFQGLLGMAYISLGLTVPEDQPAQGGPPIKEFERSLFRTAIAVNRLRNKEGTGHGRPWLPTLTSIEARAAIESVGTVSAYLLAKLRAHLLAPR